MNKPLSYKSSGVNRDTENETKEGMVSALETNDKRVLNKIGAFASLYDGSFPEYQHPVLVLKTEEPGTKQLLAFQYDKVESVCHDLVNHLVNDAIVMGAKPLSIQDCIICGKVEKSVVLRMVKAFAEAAKNNECTLTGGETSWQPGTIAEGVYVLTASIVGVVDKKKIIDGAKIREGDIVLALASSGVHTNGLSLVRKIMETAPEILKEEVGGKPFIDALLTPHRAYYKCLKDLFENVGLVGLAHITGGGIQENLNRILPENLSANVDLSKVRILPIFQTLKKFGDLEDQDMLRTFNMGVGLTVVVRKEFVEEAKAHIKSLGVEAYEMGTITEGSKTVQFTGQLNWQ
ncbi:phosphoribosylformylglycinamidine cyclo-ligase [Candidatus Kaiserbacteria bacterium RIFCSPHIGHO2_02_FULL_54_11b]|uniref:Phosphoribosylformylglycinamidine cyclo-ligase n=2 Tax=Candidatus Kaiseribacteriota TaxID=1752734 RepID=A0A1F6CHM8_9BACT|nr:MAG: phosphoribosylformylglycinamidine cyclo-ligase [Candidatus Kaiserbacteria bacterium RIFCSPHIGHO2_01_FULL_54_36b]OGG64412.1 MAG: phosphoribosylformylglycinamidine cyclo-ligase [Candidatus Kaiserbacteria bacterium RIFCSPHIGHO2_02_FULL_54_11b]